MSRESRQHHLDFIAGVLIIYMVFHHTGLYESLHQFLTRILFFFMPWFFFKAGVFYSPEKSMRAVILSSSKRLLIPFVVFCIIGQLIEGIHLLFIHNLHKNFFYEPFLELIKYGSIWTNGPVWFLWSLFCVRLIFHTLTKCKCYRLIIVSMSLFFAFLCFYFEINKPLYLGNICLGLFFYGLGNLLQKLQYNHFVGTLCILLYFIIIVFFPVGGSFVENASNNYWWWIFASIIAIVAYNYLFGYVKVDNGFFHFCGRHSLAILVIHFPIIRLFGWVLN